ncbi:glutamate 5-kinase [Tessaracoccus rhinocerotis]|uniref:Glutamate 5-kinase n=1 Tax=Tessaracoccus rhinocerotis TaxID=1689449 RepID=A0A553K4J5_9ACTN|nr:glutamate 5-kinase [Tessaracoccus rhinocerotis]TRY19614.1 glutamate 5-kinase [Tessaracoccus rhinocerotis]
MRSEVRNASRLVVKVGSSSLTTPDGNFDVERVETLAAELSALHHNGCRVVLVTSGAIAAGLAPLGLDKRPGDLETQQAAAAVGQGILVQEYRQAFARHDVLVAQLLLTVDDVLRRTTYRNALNTISRLFRLGVVPVINENDTTATHEIRFGDNDRLAALVAHLVRADALVLLTDVDGLYTAHPSEPGSELITEVADVERLAVDTSRVGSKVGTGGMRTKLEAAKIASQAGIQVILGHADQLPRILAGEEVGTHFTPIGKRRPRRLLWLAHAARTRGSLHVDEGAVRALRNTHASLLAAGVVRVEGAFNEGDPVAVVGPDGLPFARGFVAYGSAELTGPSDQTRAVIHRDRLILL